MDILQEINKMNIGEVFKNSSLKNYNTYKIDSRAEYIVYPKNVDRLIELLKFIKENGIRYKILGKGSNVIFSDKIYDGIIIKLDRFDELIIDDKNITVGAGYDLMKLAIKLSRMGYTGLEFATGIPGSVGGAVFMNAGAYNSEMANVIKEVTVLTPNLEVKKMSKDSMDFEYRSSFLKKNDNYICLGVCFILEKGNKSNIIDLINDRKKRRLASQPLEYPSAGSVFRNPEGNYAGHLIEECGLKGKKIGDALVSEKHANFIVNNGKATGSDIRNLILCVKDSVRKKYNIELQVEQEFVNWE